MMKKFIISILFATTLFELYVLPDVNSINFRHLTVQNGLSQKWVRCIIKDDIGYLWIGTAYGLNKYDGISFTTYKFDINDSNSINHNSITAVFKDSKGNLWIGTQIGFNKYQRETDNFHRIKHIQNYVNSFLELKDGNLMVGSPGGLYVYDPVKDSSWQINTYFNIEKIIDVNGQIWLGTRQGIYIYDTLSKSFDYLKITDNQLPIIKSLYIDKNGTVWAGTENLGLFSIKKTYSSSFKYQIKNFKNNISNPNSINKGTIYAICEDDKNNLWIGIENGGINIISSEYRTDKEPVFIHLMHNPFISTSIGNNSIHALYFDNQKTMWVGTYGRGISYTNELLYKFENYRQIPGSNLSINNNDVTAILDDNDYLFIGTEGGLNVYDKKSKIFNYYKYDPNDPKSIGSDVIWAIFRDSRGSIWVGTWGGGLNLFDLSKKTFRRFTYNENDINSIGSNNITKIIEDKKGNLWISTMGGGLNYFDYSTKTFKRYLAQYIENSISGNWINDIVEDNEGNLWIALTDAVDYFDIKNNRFRKVDINTFYKDAKVLFKDSKENIWIGTSNGLICCQWKTKNIIYFNEKDGLASNDIKAICEDNEKNLWISTNNGLSKLYNAVNLPKKPIFKNYTISDGLQGNDFNLRASYKNQEGLLFFGGPNGYNIINPKKILENRYVPKIVFKKLLVFNKIVKPADETGILKKDISLVDEIKLTRKQSVFTIEYAALNFIASEETQYSYILEGFEKEWNYVGQQRTATYTNLDPGTYIFKVKASNNDGLWNEQGISLQIIILPDWWQTWYAKILYVILIVLAIYFFRKHTIISVNLKNKLWLEHMEKQKIEEIAQLKQQFFINISHELRTPLTLIIDPLKQFISKNKNSEYLHTVYRNALRLKILVDQILDFSKLENQMLKTNKIEKNIIEIIENNLSNFTDLVVQKGVELSLSSNVSKCICKIDEDKIDKIITNIISNAIKNTSAGGKITTIINIDVNNPVLKLSISDTGHGIAPEEIKNIFDRFFTSSNISFGKAGTGIGLNLTHKLVEMLNGTIEVESSLGKGTTFRINLPIEITELVEEEISIQYSNISYLKPKEEQETNFESSILVIDDNEEMCNYIKSILKDKYNVYTENNPVQAFNNLQKYMPDIIISDVMMPDMNGFELCSKIKSDVRFSHIPLILLTVKSGADNQVIGYETGADDYLNKPFESKVLIARIKNLIQHKENLRLHFIGNDGIINSHISTNKLDIGFMENIINIIKKQHSNPDFNVNDIINEIGMSRSVFYKKFKALSNQPINDLIRNYRLKKAAELLKQGNLNISQVAFECGFNDPAYFSKVFKEYFKLPPKDFIAKYSNNKN